MKRVVLLCLVVILLLSFAPATKAYVPPDQPKDPCDLCAYIPHWCMQCLVDLWWNEGGCFPGDPDCF
ncbi:MAG: hypothetical protein KAY32_03065 [Candidatus Eisenbacteria sp.]|nr:hypothetical protein [Candidatus Eisenbacteria bacterium]